MKNQINFYFGLEKRSIVFDEKCEYRPTDILLYYLRNHLKAKATREGCGVGDCGACTVVLAEIKNGKVSYYPVNSCLYLLGDIDGKWLIISDHLQDGDILHPVQEALLDYYGVQCGFCTSGMLMSMFATYKNTIHPSRHIVEDRMTGNLCRCTGYQSILDATIEACDGKPDKFTRKEPEIIEWLKQNEPKELDYNIGGVKYYRPSSLKAALRWHSDTDKDIIFCGASDVMVMHHKMGTQLSNALDLSILKELNNIGFDNHGLNIGASVNMEQIRGVAKEHFPEIYKLLGRFASFQIRQIATLAGNLAGSSPIGDSIPMLMAHHAIIRLARLDDENINIREVDIRDFITGYKKNVINTDEIIYSIFIPFIPNDTIVRCFKVSNRRSVDIASVSLSTRYILRDNKIEEIELYYGGMADRVKRATNVERHLIGKQLNIKSIKCAKEHICKDFTPLSDARSTAPERIELAENLLYMLCPEISQEVESSLINS